ncbi:N-acetylmuramoyl-L-alanine amidase [Nocardioides sp. Leaf285]|uniref:N-acetylmuramoyl-L-alanine amidase n=1 Tax=Nocardioides sp. Leaf285 TaxID=1736322 RepID=UPI0009EC2500|nr:N-acetylmuramoyl-L-alanine amidase [Nocardioides sp. Leaf285]
MSHADAGRRKLLIAAGAGVVAVPAIAALARWGPGQEPTTPDGRLMLSADDGSDVGELEVALDDRRLRPVDASGRVVQDDGGAGAPSGRRVAGAETWSTGPLETTSFAMLGLTWRGSDPVLRVRTRSGGAWAPWRSTPALADGPDAGVEGDSSLRATDVTWVGRCDGVEVAVDGPRPEDLRLVLLDPAGRPTDASVVPDEPPTTAAGGSSGASTVSATVSSTVSARADDGADDPGVVPAASTATLWPKLYSRKTWGADESWRSGTPTRNATLQQVHVHHTVNANDYSRAETPALLRGMYRYHTKSLGWSDIGYNFLVDRFGRIWVGRAGGPGRNVRGAHTLGFNDTSTGVSVIGNFETARPSKAVIFAVTRVAAWKLEMHGRKPAGTATVRSTGSDRYSAGATVKLPVIDGHRDTNDTACPGSLLYAQLPLIRKRTRRRIARFKDGTLGA